MHTTPRFPELAGRVALVTGANHGIGAATAEALAAEGVRVALSYLRLDVPPDPGLPEVYREQRAATADDVVARIRSAGGTAVALEADLADPAAPAQVVAAVEDVLGPVEILVNNASSWLADTFTVADRDQFGRDLRRVDAASLDHQFAVDARAAALLIAELARRHVERGATWGRIVGLTSGGSDGFPGEVSYGAAKAAMEEYTRSAASELAPWGITANVVHPPITDTGWITDELRAVLAGSDQHVASPAEVAEVVVALVSDLARYVTGNVIRMR